MADRVFDVRFTLGAENDLEAIHRHLRQHRSPAKADALLDTLLVAIDTLERFPERGAAPRELANLGVREYRQMLLYPYRIIYRVIEQTVYVFVIADGRRDIQSLLERRLLDS